MSVVSPSDGPVAVTGASGYIGSHVVGALLARGFDVRACVTDPANPDKTRHLEELASAHDPELTFHRGSLLEPGSYDAPFAECSAVLHVGTAMAYGDANDPRRVYDGAVDGTKRVLASVQPLRSSRGRHILS